MKDIGRNQHAEGYVGFVPAANAPSGMALAGHPNCHGIPIAFSFLAILHAMNSVNNLITHMFVNNVPHLKSGGKLEMLTFVAEARTIGSCNQVVKDLGKHNPTVVKLELTAKKVDIKYRKISVAGDEPHVQVLQHWSTLILDNFETKNNAQLVFHESKVNSLLQQLVAQN